MDSSSSTSRIVAASVTTRFYPYSARVLYRRAVAARRRDRPERRRGLGSWPRYRRLLLVAPVPPLLAALSVQEPAAPAPPGRSIAFAVSGAAVAALRLPPAARRTPGSRGDLSSARTVAGLLRADG